MRLSLRDFMPIGLLRLNRALKHYRRQVQLDDVIEDISGFAQKYSIEHNKECVIIGNGPSLTEIIEGHISFFENKSVFCVNAFSTSDYFEVIRPQFYVFADYLYWDKKALEFYDVIHRTRDALISKVNWPLVLCFPISAKIWNFAIDIPVHNKNISIIYYNNNLNDSEDKFYKYKENTAAPLCQTVTISALFLGLNLGFSSVYLAGVDMSLHKNIHVTQNNVVCNRDEHFYDIDKAQLKPWLKDLNTPITMDLLFYRLSLMFRGFIEMEEYSKFLGAKVYNLSKNSFIDAFERIDLNELKSND